MRAAEVDVTIGIEPEGWPLLPRFVSLGVDLGVVNGCVRPPAGPIAREITELPPVGYYTLRVPGPAADTRVDGPVDELRTHLRKHRKR